MHVERRRRNFYPVGMEAYELIALQLVGQMKTEVLECTIKQREGRESHLLEELLMLTLHSTLSPALSRPLISTNATLKDLSSPLGSFTTGILINFSVSPDFHFSIPV